jgi:hypothetical protein
MLQTSSGFSQARHSITSCLQLKIIFQQILWLKFILFLEQCFPIQQHYSITEITSHYFGVYFMMLSVPQNIHHHMARLIRQNKGFARKQSWPNQGTILEFVRRNSERPLKPCQVSWCHSQGSNLAPPEYKSRLWVFKLSKQCIFEASVLLRYCPTLLHHYVISKHWATNTQRWSTISQKKKGHEILEVLVLGQPVRYHLRIFQPKTLTTQSWEKVHDRILKLGVRELVGIMEMGSKIGNDEECIQHCIRCDSYV